MAMNNCYSVFEENQVLTAEQLNRNFDALNHQDRLTRLKIAGAGILHGFALQLKNGLVMLSPGCAITSDGALLHFDAAMVFDKYRAFEDRQANYPFFIHADTQVPLFELLPKGAADTDAKPLSTLNAIKQMVVLLYLESYEEDLDQCTDSDCDNKGRERCQNLRAVLLHRNDLAKLQATIPALNQYYFALSELVVERVVIQANSVHRLVDLQKLYRAAIDRALANLMPALEKSFLVCSPFLRHLYRNGSPVAGWKAVLSTLKNYRGSGIQYVYEFLRDLVVCYSEFREVLFELDEYSAVDELDIQLFPRHICLGDLSGAGENRHGYYASSLIGGRRKCLEKAAFFHQRIDSLIRCFAIPDASVPIRVTPSRCYNYSLAERAIPYYYKVSSDNRLHEFWSYELYRRRRSDSILSYHAREYSSRNEVLEPLQYSHHQLKHFRIEGCLGKKIDDVLVELKRIVSVQNLPIQFVAVQIESDLLKLKPRREFNFGELGFLHRLFRNDLRRNLLNLKAYNQVLDKTVSEAKELPENSPVDPAIPYKRYVKKHTSELAGNVEKIEKILLTGAKQFDQNEFESRHRMAVMHASNLNQVLKGVTQSSVFTPFEILVNDSRFSWLGWIGSEIKRKEEKEKKVSVFDGFLGHHSGLEHFGGVKRGELYVLVYSSRDDLVVADFSVPCCCEMQQQEVVEEEEVVDISIPDDIKWPKINDIRIFRGEGFELKKIVDLHREDMKEKILSFDENLGKVREELISKVEGVNAGWLKKIDRISGDVDKKLGDNFTSIVREVDRVDQLKKQWLADFVHKEGQLTGNVQREIEKAITNVQKQLEKADISFNEKIKSNNDQLAGKLNVLDDKLKDHGVIVDQQSKLVSNYINEASLLKSAMIGGKAIAVKESTEVIRAKNKLEAYNELHLALPANSPARRDLDKMSANETLLLLKEIRNNDGKIGDTEEAALAVAIENKARISDVTAKRTIDNEVRGLTTAFRDNPRLTAMLRKFNP